MADKYLLPW